MKMNTKAILLMDVKKEKEFTSIKMQTLNIKGYSKLMSQWELENFFMETTMSKYLLFFWLKINELYLILDMKAKSRVDRGMEKEYTAICMKL